MSQDPSEDESSSSYSEEGSDDLEWVPWFLGQKGSEYFCEIDEEYMQDDFNLYGLAASVDWYEQALDLILNVPANEDYSPEEEEAIETSAEYLYGLIHARFILTARGLAEMEEKYKNCDFGRCPRVYCQGQPVLPVGLSDLPRQHTVKVFCPRCEDVYYPRSTRHSSLDGAFFGTTFPHLFFQTYPELIPPRPTEKYLPKIFGFRIHKSARLHPTDTDADAEHELAARTMIDGTSAMDRNQADADRLSHPISANGTNGSLLGAAAMSDAVAAPGTRSNKRVPPPQFFMPPHAGSASGAAAVPPTVSTSASSAGGGGSGTGSQRRRS